MDSNNNNNNCNSSRRMLTNNNKTLMMKKLILTITILLHLITLGQDRKMKVSEEIDTINIEIIKLQDENKNLHSSLNLLKDEINLLQKELQIAINLKADEKTLNKEIESIKSIQKQNNSDVQKSLKNKAHKNSISELSKSIENTNNEVLKTNNALFIQNSEIEKANSSISDIKKTLQNQGVNIQTTDKKVKQNNTYIILSLLLGFLLLIACIVIYKLTSKNKKDVDGILELDGQLKSLLEKQGEVLKGNQGGDNKEDALANVKMVADEITTMENNIFHMDKSTRGLNRIERAIKNLRNNFKTMGYDIPVLIGKEFSDGDMMEVIGEEENIESIEKGKRIITMVATPRIDYKGKMIQRAKVKLKSNL